ncbi:copper homeostasis protein CutC [Sphingomonas morindae]|uniref:PF03932 family protein CutC n=1 Tax=Sphingomonas morindae TaxID=1541170 RepID=A0ABY4X751_9SPHN|nr:copper homeostasis protein CutC [Sphingomonas morindae]USI72748.1 copper homeostasis protein CutC [Sphingomonas morindae]
MTLEICVEDAAGLAAALAGGADRIELCAALDTGGVTASAGLMRAAAALPLPVVALIRPRVGDFVYDAAEAAMMAADIRMAAEAGLAGVAIGALHGETPRLDEDLLAALIGHARAAFGATPPLLTLHRAADLCADPDALVEAAVALGFQRILTSGGALRAIDGLARLRRMAARAGPRLVLLPAAGIDADGVAPIVHAARTGEVHASARSPRRAPAPLGFAAATGRTDAGKVAALKAALAEATRR